VLATLRLVSEELKQSRELRQVLSGLPPGDQLRERLLLYLSTESVNWLSMEIILNDCSLPSIPVRITKSYSSIKGSEMRLEVVKHCYSLITNVSPCSMSPPCKMMESNISKSENLEVEENQTHPRTMCVIDSTVKPVVDLLIQPVNINILAKGADKPVMENWCAVKEIEGKMFGMRPRYLHHNLWAPDADPLTTAAEWMLLVEPLPQPSQSEFKNLAVMCTISQHPKLFELFHW